MGRRLLPSPHRRKRGQHHHKARDREKDGGRHTNVVFRSPHLKRLRALLLSDVRSRTGRRRRGRVCQAEEEGGLSRPPSVLPDEEGTCTRAGKTSSEPRSRGRIERRVLMSYRAFQASAIMVVVAILKLP